MRANRKEKSEDNGNVETTQQVRDRRCGRYGIARGFTGKLRFFDNGGDKVTRKRGLWGTRYVYEPRPPMLRAVIDIERAAKLRTYDDSRGLGFERWKPFQPLEVRGCAVEEEVEGGEIAA